ncbi:MAG TPA: MerR family transcriptional regulator [Chitinivibrionales bacterium]|nr:MerR family transcriptional regulator [Chitinivibrionales bacterium]
MLDNKKTYYSISEVCEKTGLEPHVLRYWESEFAQLRPKKNRAGNRAYRDKDIEVIRYIKHLLYEDQFTIPGAKKKLAESKEFALPLPTPPQEQQSNGHVLQEVSRELRALLQILKK